MPQDDAQPKPKLVDLDLTLRTPQVDYLEYLCERDDVSLSDALRKVVASAMQRGTLDADKPSQKCRKHLALERDQLDFVDRLGVKWGLNRSDVTRRLIDEERSMDLTL